jgi:hypothetical protein
LQKQLARRRDGALPAVRAGGHGFLQGTYASRLYRPAQPA